MKLALIGSRNFTDYESFKAAILKILSEDFQLLIGEISHIISGGAKGADKLAERFADEFGIEKEIYPVTKEAYRLYGKAAPLKRNAQIVQSATHLIAFPSRSGSGTQYTHNLAVQKGIPRKLLFID